MHTSADPASPRPFLLPVNRENRIVRLLLFIVALPLAVLLTEAVILALVKLNLMVRISFSQVAEGAGRLEDENQLLAMLAFVLACLAAFLLAFACLIWRRSPATFLWPGRTRSWRLLGYGALLGVGLSSVFLPLGAWIEGLPLTPPMFNDAYPSASRAGYAVVAVVTLLIAAAAEEVVFRGVVLQATAAFVRKPLALIALNGLLFALVHLEWDPVVFTSLALAGALGAWATLELGGVEFAIGAHFTHNLAIMLFAAPFSEGMDEPAHAVPAILVLDIAAVLVTLIVVKTIRRRRSAAA